MNTNKKVQPESKYTPSGVTEQLPPAPKYMGGSGAFGLVGGANLVSAGKQILKSGIAKGAINLVKSIFKKKRTTSITNPIPGSTKAYNKLQYPMGKKAYSSKPVDFKGPNPAHNTGAGGNSYPK
jgi:hypothetical protein